MKINKRYELAKKKLPIYWNKLVHNENINVVWSKDGKDFLLFVNAKDGDEIISYNTNNSNPKFSVKKSLLTNFLSKQKLNKKSIDLIVSSTNKGKKIKESSVEISYDNKNEIITYIYQNHILKYNLKNLSGEYEKIDLPEDKYVHISPCKDKYAWIENNNLVYKNISYDKKTILTSDGEEKYSYGELPFLGKGSTLARQNGALFPNALAWSPSGRYIFCIKLDERKMEELPLIQHIKGESPIRPEIHSIPYSLPGEEIAVNEIYIFDTKTNSEISHEEKPFPYFGMFHVDFVTSENQHNFFWSDDERYFYYLISDRGQYNMTLKKIEINTGKVSEIINEHSDTYVDMAPKITDYPTIRPLFKSNKLIWYSEKTGWAHLYMHNLDDGKELFQITSGEWRVREIVDIDEDEEIIYFTAGCREPEYNPYWEGFYKVNFDGSNLELLTKENANHIISFNKKSKYFVDQYSSINSAQITLLKHTEKNSVDELIKADVSELLKLGWTDPEYFKSKAADNKTEVYGAIFKPSHFDETKKYPILDYIYPGPQSLGLRDHSFGQDNGQVLSMVELGFVIVIIEGRGTSERSKPYHDYSYGQLEDNGSIEDHIHVIKNLSETRKYMNINKVGMYGHSGGGYSTANALLKYSDFYKVGVASSGNYDNLEYNSRWGEKYQGKVSDEIYSKQATRNYVSNLKGKLLLMHGDMDDNVYMYHTLRLAHELIQNNKDFDMLIIPEIEHSPVKSETSLKSWKYFWRKRWDYFVEHLLEETPPSNFEL
ncbi:S9 family peptidase [Chloroflexi bacterium]|nr:S9 family peptidase [Chloroflexota bacterium]